jgi:Domain of Unknown Function (DUF1206)
MRPIAIEAERATAGVRDAARRAAPWIERFARLGYLASAVVYVVIGLLAARAAAGEGGKTTGTRGALRTIVEQPKGQLLLAVIAAGLFGYAAWQLVAALTDAERKGTEPKGLALRAGMVGTAVITASLGVAAVRLIMGSGGGGDDGQRADHWTARLLGLPLGRWIVALVGAGVVAYGLYQLHRAYAAKVREHLDLSTLGPATATWVVHFGRFGLAARGVVFGVIGWFLIRAAATYDPREASDLGEALAALERQPYGAWLLGAVAFGLVAFGLYQLVNARYRRIDLV